MVYPAASMLPRHLARAAAAALALLSIPACGGRSPLSVPDCNAAALAYCQTDGCPFLGPASSTPAGVSAWCSAAGAFSPRVTGYGSCTDPAGQIWATDVMATDGHGNVLYLLYDPATAELLSVSTVSPGDAATDQVDYGTCGESAGLVSCKSSVYACDR
jgi:predicted small lipoprotein YifL